MLKSELPEINLDDQSYGDILKAAIGRIPWLYPEWTDFNAHDPGITILELLAWYKETQQYHLNFMQEETYRALIKLLGLKINGESCAECLVRLPFEEGARYPDGTRFESPDGASFELDGEIDPSEADLREMYIEGSAVTDVTQLLNDELIAVPPFNYAGEPGTSLLLRFEKLGGGSLRLYMNVSDASKVARNPFGEDDDYQPRKLKYSLEGYGELETLSDETHSLSVSGYLTLKLPEPEKRVKSDAGAGLPEGYYLRIALADGDGGCEEIVRLLTVSADLYRAKQLRTLAKTVEKQADDGKLVFDDALSLDGEVLVFTADRKAEDGLKQAEIVSVEAGGGRKTIEAALDGRSLGGKVICVTLDPLMCGEMLFDSSGLPNQTVMLNTMSQTALSSRLTLICDTLMRDGSVSPAVWTLTGNLKAHGPRDRVFAYDPSSSEVTFGDGLNGAIPPKGKKAILVSSLEISLCGGGNLPSGRFTSWVSSDQKFWHTEAVGGVNAERAADAIKRLPELLDTPKKCASLADYERLALSTPGLRIASAKAIPCYDPDSPVDTLSKASSKDSPAVTIAVLPYSDIDDEKNGAGHALPDRRFLERVAEYVGRYRPVCSVVRIIAPRYLAVSVSVKLAAYSGEGFKKEAEKALGDYFSRDGMFAIGRDISRDSLTAALYKLGGVKRVIGLEIKALDAGAYQSADGTLRIPQNAAAYLASSDIQIV